MNYNLTYAPVEPGATVDGIRPSLEMAAVVTKLYSQDRRQETTSHH